MTSNLQSMILRFFSQIPEDTFDARLKEIGVEEDNIKKLKEMISYGKITETKKGEESTSKS